MRVQGGKGSFSILSERSKFLRDFKKKTSAFSASSFLIFLFSCAEDPGKERDGFPIEETNHKPQRYGRTQRGGNRYKNIPLSGLL